jgi:hypothetical protein
VDTNDAPGAVAEAIASVPVVTPAAEPTPMDPSDAARQLSQWRHQKNKQPETPAEAPAQVQDSAPPEEAPAEAEAPAPAEELPPIDAPRSWTKDEQERFKTYPRELQAYLSEREQERDRECRGSKGRAGRDSPGATSQAGVRTETPAGS